MSMYFHWTAVLCMHCRPMIQGHFILGPFRLHVGVILIHGESIPILMKKKKKKERSK